jgi:large subunit ribosomal protein L15
MILTDIGPAKGSVKKKMRVGRGNASKGGESGRGHKGQKSRSGYKSKPGFEGGQTPLYRRLPKKRGFRALNKRDVFILNLRDLEVHFGEETNITLEMIQVLFNVKANQFVKVLSDGEISKAYQIQTNLVSKAALEKLQAAGGKVEIITK